MGAGRRRIFKSIGNEVASLGCYYGTYGSLEFPNCSTNAQFYDFLIDKS
jgi:hypothetical protein